MSKTIKDAQKEAFNPLNKLSFEMINNLQSDNYNAAKLNLEDIERAAKTPEKFKEFLNQDDGRHLISNRLLKATLYHQTRVAKRIAALFVRPEILQKRIDMVALLMNKGLNPSPKDISSLMDWGHRISELDIPQERKPSLNGFNAAIASQPSEQLSMMVSKVSPGFKIYAEEMAEVIRHEVKDANYAIGSPCPEIYQSAQSTDWFSRAMHDKKTSAAWINYCKSDVFKNGMILHSKILNTTLEDFQACILLGANIRSVNQYGQTILEFAISNNMLVALGMLIDAGIGINEPNSKGQTLLHIASSHNEKSKQIMEFLLSRGADANARDINGATPLHLAAKSDSVQNLELLLAHGADINATDNKGLTALDYTLTFLKYQGDRDIGVSGVVPTFSQHIIADYLGNEASYPDDIQFLASLDAIKFLINQGAYYNDKYVENYMQYYPEEVRGIFADGGRDRELLASASTKKARCDEGAAESQTEETRNTPSTTTDATTKADDTVPAHENEEAKNPETWDDALDDELVEVLLDIDCLGNEPMLGELELVVSPEVARAGDQSFNAPDNYDPEVIAYLMCLGVEDGVDAEV